MQAIRNIYSVQNKQIIIDLPDSFDYKSVEVIIIPAFVKNNNANPNKKERLKKLLSLSVWEENDINRIIESQNLINQWKIEEF